MKNILLLVVLSLAGCGDYPAKRYYELDEAIEKAETPEERAYYEEHARRIEKAVEEADQFIEQLLWCQANAGDCKVVCVWNGPYLKDPFNFERHDISDIEKKYRWWMKVKPPTCGFLTNFR